MSKARAEYLNAVIEAGFSPSSIQQNRHRKVTATHPDTGDLRYTITLPVSPGEYRGLLNFRSQLRRLVRSKPGPHGRKA